MARPGEQQFGISNVLEDRLRTHARVGWEHLDHVGPFDGKKVFLTEKKLIAWLKETVGSMPGTRENWVTTELEVQTLKELFDRAEIDEDFRLA